MTVIHVQLMCGAVWKSFLPLASCRMYNVAIGTQQKFIIGVKLKGWGQGAFM